MKINRNFPGGQRRGCKNKKSFRGGSMDIFWNCMHITAWCQAWGNVSKHYKSRLVLVFIQIGMAESSKANPKQK